MTPVLSTETVTRIECRVGPYDWPFPRDEAQRIEPRWAELRSEKPGLFDGPVLMARDLAVTDNVMTGKAFVAGYKSFLCWRDFDYPGAEVFNVFAMPALRSADGVFLLGSMSAGTANAGRLYFPAGTPEPADVGPDGCVDFDGNILRELEEETGLAPSDVALDASWTILWANPLVACIKVARSRLPATALSGRVRDFLAAQRDPELEGIHLVAGPADFDAVRMPPFMLHYLAQALQPSSVD